MEWFSVPRRLPWSLLLLAALGCTADEGQPGEAQLADADALVGTAITPVPEASTAPATGPETQPATADDPASQPTTAAAPESQAAPAAPAAEPAAITARLVEWGMGLSSTTVPAGQVTFRTSNAGALPHALQVEGRATGSLRPGGSTTLTVNLPAGRYEVYCPLVTNGLSHREQGMRATLVVR